MLTKITRFNEKTKPHTVNNVCRYLFYNKSITINIIYVLRSKFKVINKGVGQACMYVFCIPRIQEIFFAIPLLQNPFF